MNSLIVGDTENVIAKKDLKKGVQIGMRGQKVSATPEIMRQANPRIWGGLDDRYAANILGQYPLYAVFWNELKIFTIHSPKSDGDEIHHLEI